MRSATPTLSATTHALLAVLLLFVVARALASRASPLVAPASPDGRRIDAAASNAAASNAAASNAAASARRAGVASTTSWSPPDDWSWADVDAAGARAWTALARASAGDDFAAAPPVLASASAASASAAAAAAVGLGRCPAPPSTALAVGCYTTRVQNQHRASWCGACYLVAVLHMVQDRWHLRLGRHPDVARMLPWVELDAQRALDDYDAHRGAVHPQWNACQGGDPARVLACMREGACALRVAREDGYAWWGHPRARPPDGHGARRDDDGARRDDDDDDVDDAQSAGARVSAFSTVPNTPDAVQRAIYARGPVVLTLDAECLLAADARGVADASERRRRNHAVTVVGWRARVEDAEGRARPCYLVRNSWGTTTVPANLPEDIKCVRRGANACDEPTRPWVGIPEMPGYVYLPMEHVHGAAAGAGLLDAGPSPWTECSVALAGEGDA